MPAGVVGTKGPVKRRDILFFDGINSLAGYNLAKATDLAHAENLRSKTVGILEKREGMALLGTALAASANHDFTWFYNLGTDNTGLYRISTKAGTSSIYYLKTSTGVWTAITTLATGLLELGSSTTQYDITNPTGTTFRYTYDGTGADPQIPLKAAVGNQLAIQAQNFNAANTGTFTVTAVGSNYFEVINASGVVESDKTVGTGSITTLNQVFSHTFAEGYMFFVNGQSTNVSVSYDGISVATENSALGHLLDSPRARKVAAYKDKLYLGDITINGINYPTTVQQSSTPLGIVALVDGDVAAGSFVIPVTDSRYVHVGGTLNVYRGAKNIDNLLIVDKDELSVTASLPTAVVLNSADELWFDGTFGLRSKFLWASMKGYPADSISLGSSTTQFDITNPSGTTFRYTYDGTGTDPLITTYVSVGDKILPQAQFFSAANKGTIADGFVVVGVGANYFEVRNAAGVVESDKTIGSGFINVFKAMYENFKKYDTFKLTGGQDDRIKMLVTVGDLLVTANENNINVWDNFTLRSLDMNIGCVADKGHVKSMGALWFIHDTGIYSLPGGQSPQLMSSPVDRYIKGATKAGLRASVAYRKGLSVFFTLGDVTLYKQDGSIEKVLSDVTLEYNQRTKAWYVHTGLKTAFADTYLAAGDADTAAILLTSNGLESHTLFSGGETDVIDVSTTHIIPSRMDTQRIYLSKQYNMLGYPMEIGVEMERGSNVECYISLESGPWFQIEGLLRKGLNMLKIKGIDETKESPPRCRYLQVSLRDTTGQCVKISRMFVNYTEGIEEEELTDFDLNSSAVS